MMSPVSNLALKWVAVYDQANHLGTKPAN